MSICTELRGVIDKLPLSEKNLHFSLGLITFFKVIWCIDCLIEHGLLCLIEGKVISSCTCLEDIVTSGFPRKWGSKSE